eukprot:13179313-Alexandrium_andersonii.AAC.1
MSASLVGSEMCIRDRPRGLQLAASGRTLRRWPRRASCQRSIAAQGKPVSYTHLTLPTICSV